MEWEGVDNGWCLYFSKKEEGAAEGEKKPEGEEKKEGEEAKKPEDAAAAPKAE